MLSKTLSMILISIPFALTVPAANAADTAGGTELTARTSTTKFLQPLCGRLSDGTRCPGIIFNGQVAGGGISNIAPAFQADLPNVRVTFDMQDIRNEPISGAGVDVDVEPGQPPVLVTWLTDGTEAFPPLEGDGQAGWVLPGPGQTEPVGHDGSGVIYDALVLNACGSSFSFPMTHESTLSGGDFADGAHRIVAAPFEGIDDSTIDSTGFYNLNYTIRAARDGRVSDFHFRGKVNVTCTGLNALP